MPLLYVAVPKSALVTRRTAEWKLIPDAIASAYCLFTMSVLFTGAVVIVPPVNDILALYVYAPLIVYVPEVFTYEAAATPPR